MRTKIFIGKIFSQINVYGVFSTINHALDSQPVTVGSCIIFHTVVVRSTKVRHINLFLYLKSVLTYESHS
jgi:hypothetical protein